MIWRRRQVICGRMIRRPRKSLQYLCKTRTCSIPPWAVTLLIALFLVGCVIGIFQARLRPIIVQVAQTEIQNKISVVIDQAVANSLAEESVQYSDFISIQRGEDGVITSITTDTVRMNQVRLDLIAQVLSALNGVDVTSIQIPLGSLIDSEVIWARGPSFCVRAMAVGTVSAEFESDFASAGVNQTIHRIWLNLAVPMTILLPGGSSNVTVDTRVCIAETVIVGQVPQLYLPGQE
ncbi:MAG: sporulation protein YunB [Lawsonibacter sp.]|jgi:sporulation protein YunB